MKKLTLVMYCLFTVAFLSAQQPISQNLFGVSAWFIDVNTTNTLSVASSFGNKIADVKSSGVKFVRIGGIGPNYRPLYDIHPTSFTLTGTSRLEVLINLIRANGMEPIVEVGFNPACPSFTPLGGLSMAQQASLAGELVDRFNNPTTGIYKTNPIRHWILANEPDLPIGSCANPQGMSFGAQTDAINIANYVKAFSTAMKDKFSFPPFLVITGPELASYGNDKTLCGPNYCNPSQKIMDDLVNLPGNANSITGTILTGSATGQYFIDVLSFHYYANYSAGNSAGVIADPSAALNGFRGNVINDGLPFNNLNGLKEMIANNSTGRTSTPGPAQLKIACTEFNLQNEEKITQDETTLAGYTSMVNGVGCRSFLGGQWMAEVFSEAMSNNLEYMNLWSVQEGSLSCQEGKGYISNCGTGTKLSEYWHYWMLANNFKGTAYTGTTNIANVKAFAAKSGDRVAVMILNQTGTNYTFGVKLDAPAVNGTLKVDFNIPGISTHSTNNNWIRIK